MTDNNAWGTPDPGFDFGNGTTEPPPQPEPARDDRVSREWARMKFIALRLLNIILVIIGIIIVVALIMGAISGVAGAS